MTESTAVTPLELFVDLALDFAVTRASAPLVDEPTWRGLLWSMLVLAELWCAWSGYAWLTGTVGVEEGGVRFAELASMAAMLVVALADAPPRHTWRLGHKPDP